MTPLTLTLPYPPTTNNAYLVRGNRKVKTTAARQYAAAVTETLLVNPDAHRCRATLQPGTRLRATITVVPPDKRRRDLSNTEKLATDAIFAWLEADDSSIDELLLRRRAVDRTNPRLVYTLEAIS